MAGRKSPRSGGAGVVKVSKKGAKVFGKKLKRLKPRNQFDPNAVTEMKTLRTDQGSCCSKSAGRQQHDLLTFQLKEQLRNGLASKRTTALQTLASTIRQNKVNSGDFAMDVLKILVPRIQDIDDTVRAHALDMAFRTLIDSLSAESKAAFFVTGKDILWRQIRHLVASLSSRNRQDGLKLMLYLLVHGPPVMFADQVFIGKVIPLVLAQYKTMMTLNQGTPYYATPFDDRFLPTLPRRIPLMCLVLVNTFLLVTGLPNSERLSAAEISLPAFLQTICTPSRDNLGLNKGVARPLEAILDFCDDLLQQVLVKVGGRDSLIEDNTFTAIGMVVTCIMRWLLSLQIMAKNDRNTNLCAIQSPIEGFRDSGAHFLAKTLFEQTKTGLFEYTRTGGRLAALRILATLSQAKDHQLRKEILVLLVSTVAIFPETVSNLLERFKDTPSINIPDNPLTSISTFSALESDSSTDDESVGSTNHLKKFSKIELASNNFTGLPSPIYVTLRTLRHVFGSEAVPACMKEILPMAFTSGPDEIRWAEQGLELFFSEKIIATSS